MNEWRIWDPDVHQTPEQRKKIERAKSRDVTPARLYAKEQEADFVSRNGRYRTTLETCTCLSFIRDKLPCKHMYRLAMELGIMSGEFQTQECEPISLNVAISEVEALSEAAQIEVKNTIRITKCATTHRVPFYIVNGAALADEAISAEILCPIDSVEARTTVLKKVGRKAALIARLKELGFVNACEAMTVKQLHEMFLSSGLIARELLPDCVPVELHPSYRKAWRKLYSYLMRKFDTCEFYDPDGDRMISYPAGSDPMIEKDGTVTCSFPDDEITMYLDLYKCNRCRK